MAKYNIYFDMGLNPIKQPKEVVAARKAIRDETEKLSSDDLFLDGKPWQDAKKRLMDKGIFVLEVR